MQRVVYFLLLGLPLWLFSFSSEEEGIRRVHAHLLIDDPSSALKEAEELLTHFPDSQNVLSLLIEVFSANGLEDRALSAWDALSLRFPDLASDRHLLEELSWGVLRKGLQSTQYGVRLSALIGSFLTHDIRAVPILIQMMRDPNAMIRSVAIQLASNYGDAPLKDEITRLMREEKVWVVRLEVIRAIGALRMKELVSHLKAIIQNDKINYEERAIAIESCLHIYDGISIDEWKEMAHSNRAGMRHFACSIAAHFALSEAKEEILRLTRDPHPSVRSTALNAIGLVYRKELSTEDVKKILSESLLDATPEVAITAAWVAQLIDPQMGSPHFTRWIEQGIGEHRRLAAAALSATGEMGVTLAAELLEKTSDPYVQANLAIGLLGQRVEVEKASNILFSVLQSEKRMWMWDQRPNPLFQVLSPSQVRYVDHIPNYPEAVDQMTRLNLVSLLALVEDPRALASLKDFLQKRSWGITGVAAATLLQEGDETALEVVRELLDDADPNVRLQACFVLAMLGRDETVLAHLQNAYPESSHERKLHILEAMGRVASPQTFHFLLAALKEPFPILRVAAASALIQSVNR